jgi:hypothetical protein
MKFLIGAINVGYNFIAPAFISDTGTHAGKL